MVFGIVGDCQASHHALSLSIHRILQCDYDMKMMGKVWEKISNNPLKIQNLQTKRKNIIIQSGQRSGSKTQVKLRTFRLRSFTANWVLSGRKVDNVTGDKSPMVTMKTDSETIRAWKQGRRKKYLYTQHSMSKSKMRIKMIDSLLLQPGIDFYWGSPNCIGCLVLAHRQLHLSVHHPLHRRNPRLVSPKNDLPPWPQTAPSSKISCNLRLVPKQGVSVGQGLWWSCDHETLYILKSVFDRETASKNNGTLRYI